MNEFLYQEICDACISRTKMPDRLLMEHMIIVAALHTSVGAEVGMGYLNFIFLIFKHFNFFNI